MSEAEVKERVRNFYDQVGWQLVGENQYQNARYEDLRPVSREYIHRCHMRVKRHLKPKGAYLLDAGSGPVQYPEYITYSEGYDYRVCLDISIVALREARKGLGDHGLYVVADVSRLPFKPAVFGGVVSLHTLHHLPLQDQKTAYQDIYRVLSAGCSAVIVNGWTDSPLMRSFNGIIRLMDRIGRRVARLNARETALPSQPTPKPFDEPAAAALPKANPAPEKKASPVGTFVQKLDANWLRTQLQGMDVDILVWRSVSVRFLRAMIHRGLGGRFFLRFLFNLEERWPHYFGEKGQYPLVVIRKPAVE